jgi:hypothetical protein
MNGVTRRDKHVVVDVDSVVIDFLRNRSYRTCLDTVDAVNGTVGSW